MKSSAGILLYRIKAKVTEVFLVHPGGPFWKNKDAGAWSIPKGEFEMGENPLEAAKREFEEETGQKIEGYFIPLQPIKQKAGKIVYAWAVEGDIDQHHIVSNLIEISWPPKSGKTITIPEVDRGDWFDISAALEKINLAQVNLLHQLLAILTQT